MTRADVPERSRSAAAAVLIVALHLALAALLMQRHPVAVPPPPATLTVTAVPMPRTAPPVEPERPLDAGVAAPAIEIAAAPAQTAPTCDVLAQVGAAAQSDTAAVAALQPLAAEPSPALMAWAGSWADQPPVPAIRTAVAKALTGLPGACLDEPVVGPRLVFITVGGTSVSVAFGSGTWRWRKLLSTDRATDHRSGSGE